MNSQYAVLILQKCASQFTMLSADNQQISNQAKDFYHNRMAGKAAQTYKHCATYLLMVADALPAIHPSLPDETLSTYHPMRRNQFGTCKHHRRPTLESRKIRAVNRRHKAANAQVAGHRAGSKKRQHQHCKCKSSLPFSLHTFKH